MDAFSNDILIEILVRLPDPKSVYRAKCVSKTWSNIISDVSFVRSYDERRKDADGDAATNLVGFFQNTIKYVNLRRLSRRRSQPAFNFLPIKGFVANQHHYHHHHRYRPRIANFLSRERQLSYFISSSNGLILCGGHKLSYFVVNPLTKRWVSLPTPNEQYRNVSVGFVCFKRRSEDLVAHYKVVRACIEYNNTSSTRSIETYSSENKTWIQSKMVAPSNFLFGPLAPPVVLRGIFHWYAWRSSIVVYNPNDEPVAGENNVQLIELPIFVRKVQVGDSLALTRSKDDVLWCGNTKPEFTWIWMLPKQGKDGYKRNGIIPSEEWRLMHTFTSESLRNTFPSIVKTKSNPRFESGVLKRPLQDNEFRLEAFIPGHPEIAILRDREYLYLFHIEKGILEPIQYGGLPILEDDFDWSPFFESTFLSTYALP